FWLFPTINRNKGTGNRIAIDIALLARTRPNNPSFFNSLTKGLDLDYFLSLYGLVNGAFIDRLWLPCDKFNDPVHRLLYVCFRSCDACRSGPCIPVILQSDFLKVGSVPLHA